MGRLVTIPFYTTVSSGATRILASKRITSGLVTKELIGSFALGVNRTLRLRFFVGSDDLLTGAALVGATNLLEFAGQVNFMVGDDMNKRYPVEVEFPRRGLYVKVSGENTDSVDHTLDAAVVLEMIDVDC